MRTFKNHYLFSALLAFVGLSTAFADFQTDRVASLAGSIEMDARTTLRILAGPRGPYDRGGRYGNAGPGMGRAEALQDLKSLAQSAQSLESSARSFRATVHSTKYQFHSLQSAHQRAQQSKYQIRRQQAVAHFYSSIQRNMSALAQIYFQGSGYGRGGLLSLAQRLDQATSRLARTVNRDLGNRRFATFEERQLLQAVARLEVDADEFKRIVDRTNGRGGGQFVRNQLRSLEFSLKEAKRASGRVMVSYTAEEELRQIRRLVQRASQILGAPTGPGRGGYRHNDFDIF